MVQKKSLLFLISSLILAMFISFGCDTSESTSGRNEALVGTWILTDVAITQGGNTETFSSDYIYLMATDFPNLLEIPEIVVMNSDGSGSGTMVNGNTDNFTWTSTSSQISFTFDEETTTIAYTLSGNQLTITMSEVDPDFGQTTIVLTYVKYQ